MSINSTVNQSYLAEVEALARLLEGFLARRSSEPTRSGKALVEAEALELFERLLALDFKLQAIEPGDYPEYDDYSEDYSMFYFLLQVNLAKLRRLTQLFIQHFNSQQYALADLLGKLKRIRQKRAALALWNGDEAKFVLADRFLNLDWLDNKFVSDASCEVDTAQGILTLPVRDVKVLPIKSVVIGSGSNGNPGNSDTEVTTNNINPEFTINGDPNNWFEYERLDSGPLELSLIVELTKEQVVNNIKITPLNIGQAYSYKVDDVLLSASGITQSARELAGTIDRDRMIVKSAGNDTDWSFTFLPAVAKTVTVKLIQTHSHEVHVSSNNGGETVRNRFAVGISRLSVNQIKYDSAGGINSVERELPGGLYVTIPFVEVWPPKPSLFEALVEVSFDGGETWLEAENVDDGIGGSVLMTGTESSMLWRLRVLREDDALDNATSLLPDESPIKLINTLMKSVNTNKSPAILALPERPARGEVLALQPKVARRGNRFRRVLLGTGSGTDTKFELPFSPLVDGLDPETMHVYVNGIEYTYEENNAVVSAGEWAFSDDFNEIEFSSDLPDRARVSAVFDEERMLFEQRADGFYHQMELFFDPDEDNIDITYLPRTGIRHTRLLPRDRRVIHLGVTNIDTDSFNLTTDGAAWTQVASRGDLGTTSQSYLLDGVNGILWLSEVLDSVVARVTFDHYDGIALTTDQFDVVYNVGSVRPWGVRIAPEAFQAIKHTDTVSGLLGSRLDVLTGRFGVRDASITSSSDAMTLTHDYIVKGSVSASTDLFDRTYVDSDPQEVDYVDGKTEFLGLVAMNRESTVGITADLLDTVVTFKLAAGALWYQGMDPLFSNTTVFSTDVGTGSVPNAPGEYNIGGDGTVTVYVGAGGTLDEGISIHYYYQDPDFEPANKYSLDYKRGVIYGGSDLQANATLTYKASGHKIAYNVAKEIDRYQYNSSGNYVSVRTEGLKQVNSLVKLIWAQKTGDSSLRDIRDFFSPIIQTLAFRFT